MVVNGGSFARLSEHDLRSNKVNCCVPASTAVLQPTAQSPASPQNHRLSMTIQDRLWRNVLILFTILLCFGGCGEKTTQSESDQVVFNNFKIADSYRA
jgi:hypothetical protein